MLGAVLADHAGGWKVPRSATAMVDAAYLLYAVGPAGRPIDAGVARAVASQPRLSRPPGEGAVRQRRGWRGTRKALVARGGEGRSEASNSGILTQERARPEGADPVHGARSAGVGLGVEDLTSMVLPFGAL